MSIPEGVQPHSIYDEGYSEALTYKWCESERRGFDQGEHAIREWVRHHWNGFLRARWIEHLQGKKFWTELDRNDFGLLTREFQGDKVLLDIILDRMKIGKENLDVIDWARNWGMPIDKVIYILEGLDVNSRRLSCKFLSC